VSTSLELRSSSTPYGVDKLIRQSSPELQDGLQGVILIPSPTDLNFDFADRA